MKNKHQLFLFAFIFFIMQAKMASGQDDVNSIRLSLKPKECVVLKEGDKCYARIQVNWKASKPGYFCLFRSPGQVQLACWNYVNEGLFTEELIMEVPVDYYLARADSAEILSTETLSLSWVYKKSSRPESTWRLF